MEFIFRKATNADLERLLEWRNDPLTRQNSKNSEPVSRKTHEAWLRFSLENQDRRLFIAEVSGKPVGTVRLDRSADEWELSWTVAPATRGKGLGKEMVKEATKLVSGGMIAQVKEGNVASLRIAEYAGFTPVGKTGEMVLLRLKR